MGDLPLIRGFPPALSGDPNYNDCQERHSNCEADPQDWDEVIVGWSLVISLRFFLPRGYYVIVS